MVFTLGMIAALGLTSRGGRELYKEQWKKNMVKTEKKSERKNISEKGFVSLEKLQTTIKDTLLEEGIGYENIAHGVDETVNEESKKEIMDFLYAGNILGLQEYLGMKKNSEFTLNKATGKIDQNTMKII